MSTSATNPTGSSAAQAPGSRAPREAAIALALAASGLGAFALFARRSGAGAAAAAAAGAAFALFFIPCVLLSVRPWRAGLRAWLAPAPRLRSGGLWILALLAYAGYAAACHALVPAELLRLAVYGIAVIVVGGGLRPASAVPLADPSRPGPPAFPARLPFLAALLVFWLPAEFRLVGGLRLPAGAAQAFDATHLALFALGLLVFVVQAHVPRVGYTFALSRRDLAHAAVGLAAFAALAIPLGLASGFIRPGGPHLGPLERAVSALAIYLGVACPEEVLFRGLIQNFLERSWPGRGGRAAALALASLVFGAAHLDEPPRPDLRYALLATLAGLAYGWVWMRTRRATASALTHAAVDFLWMHLFGGVRTA